MVFLLKPNGYQKMCDTNKNVIKMGVIIKGVYYIEFGKPICTLRANVLAFINILMLMF
jgi:hypothetical protein